MDSSYAANIIIGPLIRSGISPALYYGEEGSESRDDFIHKTSVVLKELRETFIGLKIIKQVPLTKNLDLVNIALIKCNELI